MGARHTSDGGGATTAERHLREAVERSQGQPDPKPHPESGDGLPERAGHRASRTAGTATTQMREIADAAGRQATRVRQEAREQLRGLADDAVGEVGRVTRAVTDGFSELRDDLDRLVRKEVQLARTELMAKVREAAKAGGVAAAGGALGLVGVILMGWAAGSALANVLPTWLAFLIVGAVIALSGAGLIAAGRSWLERIDPVPEATMRTLRKDKEWLREKIS